MLVEKDHRNKYLLLSENVYQDFNKVSQKFTGK